MTKLPSLRSLTLPLFAAATCAQGFQCDFAPAQSMTLNTNFQQISCGGPPVNVSGGLFAFRSVRIPAGVTVRGSGSAPLIFVVLGDVVIDGELNVSGGNGTGVDTLNSANIPAPGGAGTCGGGNGGTGSPSTTGTDLAGQAGYGPFQAPGFGGAGGRASCSSGRDEGRGSGGGGGSFATIGDPYYKRINSGLSMVQQTGAGGLGGLQRTLAGGRPGPALLTDGRLDNDFYGIGFDLAARRVVGGELPSLTGGCGGAGGGDRGVQCLGNPLWMLDSKGGGGGAGGGAVMILAGGRIVVNGKIRADGGHGGGGEQASTNDLGGGGGGGSGGMIALYSYTHIELRAHGETYANNDYDFALSADGGVGLQGAFGGNAIPGKYPPAPVNAFDLAGAGGFGGLGVIQLAVPIDGRNTDGTNTIFDDHIHVVQNGQRLTGATKQRYLAWRGYQDPAGVGVDDNGRPTGIGANEGDLRPSPALLPLF